MSDTEDDFEETLAAAFRERFDATEDDAEAAASKAAAFRADVDESLTTDDVLDGLEVAEAYDSFRHRFDLVIGDLAAADDDCTDSRPYRLAGFDDFAADPEIGG
ncbi:MAG: hypothetical protein PPP58_00980 [Natronomonas sp.]